MSIHWSSRHTHIKWVCLDVNVLNVCIGMPVKSPIKWKQTFTFTNGQTHKSTMSETHTHTKVHTHTCTHVHMYTNTHACTYRAACAPCLEELLASPKRWTSMLAYLAEGCLIITHPMFSPVCVLDTTLSSQGKLSSKITLCHRDKRRILQTAQP